MLKHKLILIKIERYNSVALVKTSLIKLSQPIFGGVLESS
jgi:hypothetical protein